MRVCLVVAVIAVPLWTVYSSWRSVVFRDGLDVFSLALSSPVMFVLPILLVLITCYGLFEQIGNRYVASLRTRLPIRRWVARRYVFAAVGGFVVLFAFIVIPAVVAFGYWPVAGNPNVDAWEWYGLTAHQTLVDSYQRDSFSFLLQLGPVPYALIYAAWTGLGGAVLACLGVASLLLIKNRFVAMTLPFLFYFGQTLAAALLGEPRLGLMYSLFPFGLVSAPWWIAAAPMLAALVGVVILIVITVRRAPTLETLA